MDSLIAPPYLKKGDTVGIVALASKLNPEDIKQAIDLMENQWELKVVVGKSVKSHFFNFAGTDEIRLIDFQQMLDNQEIKAIFSARGGYGSSRLIDEVDFAKFTKNPKWLVGFSDITAVNCHIQNLGFQSLHAPMPKTFFRNEKSLETLKNCLFGEPNNYEIQSNEFNRNGRGEGQIIGGNLCLLAHLIGSKSDLNWENKIVFIEEIGEYLYNIDRMVVQLKRAGKLENLAGLVVGSFSDIKQNDEPFGKSAYEIIGEHTSNYNYPIAYDFPVGHENLNYAIPCGRLASLIVNSEKVSLNFFDESLTMQ